MNFPFFPLQGLEDTDGLSDDEAGVRGVGDGNGKVMYRPPPMVCALIPLARRPVLMSVELLRMTSEFVFFFFFLFCIGVSHATWSDTFWGEKVALFRKSRCKSYLVRLTRSRHKTPFAAKAAY